MMQQQLLTARLIGLLFLACLDSSRAQTRSLVVEAGTRWELWCAVGAGAEGEAASWRHNGTTLSATRLEALGLRSSERVEAGGVVLALGAARAEPEHAGLYECGAEQATRLVVSAAAAGVAGAGESVSAGAEAADGEPGVVLYEVGQAHLELVCTLPGLAPDATVDWSKNGTSLTDSGSAGSGSEDAGTTRWHAEGLALKLSGRAHEDDYGNYTCARGEVSQSIELRARTIAKLPANTNVVEGQKLKLSCKLLGRPYERVTWLFANSSASETDYGQDAVSALTALGVEVKLQQSEAGAEDGELVLEAANKNVAGRYSCYSGLGNRNATTTLRVKDMYAALWPFLGIVLEVIILCSVIAVYERRRTKPDLADSDTDTPNQKKS